MSRLAPPELYATLAREAVVALAVALPGVAKRGATAPASTPTPTPAPAPAATIKHAGTFTWASTKFDLPAALAQPLLAYGRSLPADLIVNPDPEWAGGGLEDEPHVTIRYGLDLDSPAPLVPLLARMPPILIRLGTTAMFPATAARPSDVLYVQVEGPGLGELHTLLGVLPHTDTQAEYHPHATIAYLRPGAATAFVGDQLQGLGEGVLECLVDAITFSARDGSKTTIPLGGERILVAAYCPQCARLLGAGVPRTATLHCPTCPDPVSGNRGRQVTGLIDRTQAERRKASDRQRRQPVPAVRRDAMPPAATRHFPPPTLVQRTDFFTDENGVVHPIRDSGGDGGGRGGGAAKEPEAQPKPDHGGHLAKVKDLIAAATKDGATPSNETLQAIGRELATAVTLSVATDRASLIALQQDYHDAYVAMSQLDLRVGATPVAERTAADEAALKEAETRLDAAVAAYQEGQKAFGDDSAAYGQHTRDLLGQIRPMGETATVRLPFVHPNSPEAQQISQGAANFPTAWLERITTPITTDPDRLLVGMGAGERRQWEGRAFYITNGGDLNGIYLPESSPSTVTHEMGHMMEHLANQDIMRGGIEFREDRTSGQAAQPLGAGYAADELTRPDDFATPYIGKISNSEVFSMGVEGVFHGRYNLAQADPGHYQWTLGALATLP